MRNRCLIEDLLGGAVVRGMLLLAVLVSALPARVYARMYEEPKSFSLQDKSLDQVDRKRLKAIDPERLLAADREQGKSSERPGPLRFAVTEDVAFDTSNSGTWRDLPDGRLWRLRIHSPKAVSHNLAITRFDLPEGAKLWIYNPSLKHVEGPYEARHRSDGGGLWTPVIEGDEVVVELFAPSGAAQPALSISKANKGYRGFGKVGILGSSEGLCNIDVVCPEGNPWQNQIRAVTVYTINGTGACTGTMLNNTAFDFKPYVLSANHCGVTTSSAATIVAYWNFQSATCGTHGPGPTTDTQSGATFRASSAPSDFVLFELNALPDPAFNVFYAGWDRSGVAPPGNVCVHQPSADVKAISFSNTTPLSTMYSSNTPDPAGNHWRVVWDVPGPNGQVAITEPGSSGSCIFASNTGRCIGQLHGGPSFCGAPAASLNDFYGKLSVSWTGGGSNATRLSNWLDPGNTGSLGIDGDPHITTLDGTHYDFQGAGEYVALRDASGAEVQARQAPIATTFTPGADPYDGLATCVSLNTAVAARVGKHRVSYQPNLSGVPDPSGLQLRVDGVLRTLGSSGIDLGNGGRIAKTGAPGGIEVIFPDKYAMVVTPGWWSSQSKWYLNIGVSRTGAASGVSGAWPSGGPSTGGIAGPLMPRSWLPALPDGSSMGPMPSSLHQRYVDLYQKFGEAWRVTDKTSLFDYAPGTSTDTFTLKTWPMENPPCELPDARAVTPLSLDLAQQACEGIRDQKTRANCVFDVQVTGERGFAKTYLLAQRITTHATTISVRDDADPTKPRESVTFTAIVARKGNLEGLPKGSVQFMLDGKRAGSAVELNARGRASWKTAKLAPGTHTITASFLPSAGSEFLGSTSADETHVVVGRD